MPGFNTPCAKIIGVRLSVFTAKADLDYLNNPGTLAMCDGMETKMHDHENVFLGILHDVFLHGILDALKIIPFLFLTYLLMELLEHKAGSKTRAFMKKSGKFAPLAGGLLGAVPQCGFSSVTANLFSGRILSMGTLLAVFLSTSDEMLPIMVSGQIPPLEILVILGYKVIVGIIVGYLVDLAIKLLDRHDHEHHDEEHIHELCREEGCHCEGGILRSSIFHTIKISIFLLIITFIINGLVFFIGEDNLSAIFNGIPVLSHLIAAVFGLIPNCASSVVLSELYVSGIISGGTMLSGLFAGAGVGIAVLFRLNRKHMRENLIIIGLLVTFGFIFGMLADLIGLFTWVRPAE